FLWISFFNISIIGLSISIIRIVFVFVVSNSYSFILLFSLYSVLLILIVLLLKSKSDFFNAINSPGRIPLKANVKNHSRSNSKPIFKTVLRKSSNSLLSKYESSILSFSNSSTVIDFLGMTAPSRGLSFISLFLIAYLNIILEQVLTPLIVVLAYSSLSISIKSFCFILCVISVIGDLAKCLFNNLTSFSRILILPRLTPVAAYSCNHLSSIFSNVILDATLTLMPSSSNRSIAS